MKIREITDQKVYTDYFNSLGSPTFLQAWEWGELQKTQGYSVLRLGFYSAEKLVGIAQIIKIRAKRGSFLFTPQGPLPHAALYIKMLTAFLVPLAKSEGYSYIRISPILPDIEKNRKIFNNCGYKKAPIHMHAEHVWILSLEDSEETLLANMRKTTRNLIRRSIRDGIKVDKSDGTKVIEGFWRVYEKTAIREHFTPFSKLFISNEFKAFNKEKNCLFFLGFDPNDNKLVASSLVLFTKSSAFYHQGASLHSKAPVSYRLQWEAILEAKRRGCQYYNFWGITPTDDPKHPWYGLSLFKKGFGGEQKDYVPTQDYIVSPFHYSISHFYERILRWKRRL